MTENTREIILGILASIRETGMYSHVAIRGALDRYQYMSKQDRAFITRVCEGTIERMIELDYIIDRFSSVPTAKMKPVIRDILRSAVYQILFMDSVPAAAACDEAVKLAQKRGFYNLKAFVNGVLRGIARGADEIAYPEEGDDPAYSFSVRYSMPEWIVREWLRDYGRFVTERMLRSSLEVRPTTVRFKTDRISPATIISSLESQGVTVKHAPYLPYAYNISDYSHMMGLAAFRNGWIFPQDIGSMMVSEAASPMRGDYVIDLCASPGGKSLHIADMMEGFGMVEARDLTEEKVALIRENVHRADLINVKPVVMDALVQDAASEGKADIVICDLPCSGLGVVSRKSDIKYRLTPDKIDSLVELQRQMLHNAASYVLPGGHLIYSTCTVNTRENIDNFKWFAANYPFEPESLDPYIPKALRSLSTADGYLQMIPGIHESDGFFIARFKRRKAR